MLASLQQPQAAAAKVPVPAEEAPVAAPRNRAPAPCSTDDLEAEFKNCIDEYVSKATQPGFKSTHTTQFAEGLRVGDKRFKLFVTFSATSQDSD